MLDITASSSWRWVSMVSMRRPSWSAMRFMASARAAISAESASRARSPRLPAAKASAPACRRDRALRSRLASRYEVRPASSVRASPAAAIRDRAPLITSAREESLIEARTTKGRPPAVSAATAQ